MNRGSVAETSKNHNVHRDGMSLFSRSNSVGKSIANVYPRNRARVVPPPYDGLKDWQFAKGDSSHAPRSKRHR
jgi:hypothetical protein